ncbi:DUF4349 domain-containing protein [Microbacterium oleivorans]|uniref:DUF4349 domain-containing protein n=1 Tax=Microbacterium oleivorans TaxID=273677 RepID=UPI00203F8C91|nr:DUF4349 domain-containing protein [Microbacterium oleivorans]MCM3696855.1 DUF4349 domain-containing protein [Microbacterium oleivorans]
MTRHEIELPDLTQERQDDIEAALFAEIREEVSRSPASSQRRRRRGWAYTGAAAAVIVVAGFVGPALGGPTAGESVSVYDQSAGGAVAPESGGDLGGDSGGDQEGSGTASTAGREVVATASTVLEATDPAAAVAEIGDRAEASGGYVESMNVSAAAPAETTGADAVSSTGGTWVTVRVPADGLTTFLTGLDDLGEVTSSEITREDVTAQSTDLRARISALQTSVDRLEGLISDAATTADLLTAEEALSQRQAELDSLLAQSEALADEVALSSATVTVVEPGEVVAADPQGFGDGFSTGWSALVATLNGIVVGLGFLLPWLAVAGIVVAVVQLVRRARRRARRRAEPLEDGQPAAR